MTLKVMTKTGGAAAQKKKVVQSVAKASEGVQERVAQVDELITLSCELEEVAPKIARRDELKKALSSAANAEFEDHEEAVFHGTLGDVIFSKRSELRQITEMNELIGKLKEKIGYEGLLALLKLTIGDCEKYLSQVELAPYLTKVPGSRTFKGVLVTEQGIAKL